MQIEVNSSGYNKRLAFPKLMYSKATNSVYLCPEQGQGIKLSGDSKYNVGEVVNYLETGTMEDFIGQVTITQ